MAASSESGGGDVLLMVESDAIVQTLETKCLDELGSARWATQHQNLEKLNMQAIMNAQTHADPFVKEALTLNDKMDVLVEQLITVELWKGKVLPLILQNDFSPNQTFPIMMVLHHEATIINLLETVLYYRDACECIGEALLDLLDYCHRKLTTLISKHENGLLVELFDEFASGKGALERSSAEEVQLQEDKIQFDICTKCVTILRYIIEHRQGLPLSVMTRMLSVHDVPCLMVKLVEDSPWQRSSDGCTQKYAEGVWSSIATADRYKITKTEGQPWIALHHLLMDSDVQRRYEFSEHRKAVILRLRAYMPDILLDQLPFLVDMKMFLERLSVSDMPAAVTSSFILEQLPEIRQCLIERYAGKWRDLAREQYAQYFNPDPEDMKKMADKWCETYDFDALDRLAATEKPRCALCGAEATKRCSKCQMEWYCKRECQVKHWKKHKPACALMTQAPDS